VVALARGQLGTAASQRDRHDKNPGDPSLRGFFICAATEKESLHEEWVMQGLLERTPSMACLRTSAGGPQKKTILFFGNPVLRCAKHAGWCSNFYLDLPDPSSTSPSDALVFFQFLFRVGHRHAVRTVVAADLPEVGGEARSAWCSDKISKKERPPKGLPRRKASFRCDALLSCS
jgi:hypothetical protein